MFLQKKILLFILLIIFVMLVTVYSGCKSAPKNVIVVDDFDVEQYLGKWYEIARFDFIHEKNMNNVTAEYSLNKDGSIRVENRGYDYKKGEWKESIGKAKFQGRPTIGSLKVSFFGPFYSGYNIIALDPNYLYSLVVGKNYDYLWILSRTTYIPEDVKSEYLNLADSLGFDLSKLVWTEQSEAIYR